MRRLRVSWGLVVGVTALLAAGPSSAAAPEVPAGLPRYDLAIKLDIAKHQVVVREDVTWTNRSQRPVRELVFNAHAHFEIPDKDVGFLAKMLEILRVNPSEGLDLDGPALDVKTVGLPGPPGSGALPFHYQKDNPTALVVPLPRDVRPGESVTVCIDFGLRLPQKQGRWGQWRGITFLSNWLPVLAYHDDKGWQPTPFVSWHQPFFNEAGLFTANIMLPCDQKLACTSPVAATRDLGAGLRQVEVAPRVARDFAVLCSAQFQEFTGEAGGVAVRCLALPEHAHYAREMVRFACEAIPVYSQWFGPYPYPDFTIVESYFGWNGNECSGLVMIDERIFGMPHAACDFVEYLVSHETCHQWWYNVVGTNGYCETWMDEGLATYFGHRLMDQKHGKNSCLVRLPKGLEWLPRVYREDYRYFGLYGTLGRGEASPTIQEIPKFGHIVNLFSMCYDKGSKIVGMIEDRLGEAAFFDFMRLVYARYSFRVLRVADFQRELEAYTGRSWEEFFQRWLYGAGLCDWSIEKVHVKKVDRAGQEDSLAAFEDEGAATGGKKFFQVTVWLRQNAEHDEQTVLGICLDGGEGYQVRLPIIPQVQRLDVPNPPARIEALAEHRVRVDVLLTSKPTQIAVDPDKILVDRDPANNYWKTPVRWRLAPIYTPLEETDLTCAYDRWNIIAGPWVFDTAYNDPWFVRTSMAGARVGAYRTQQFTGGVYTGYRTDFQDLAAGVDLLWDHWPWAHTQVGFNAEYSLVALTNNSTKCNRGVLFGRYIIDYGDSLYLPPMHYVETFTSVQDNPLPLPSRPIPGSERFSQQTTMGLHYHINYLTPYWDPEGGFRFDATCANGVPIFGQHEASYQASGELAWVNYLPETLGWLSETRVAARVYGAGGVPDRGLFFTLGGSMLFRGYDLAERQGNVVWVGSLEWRVPLARGLRWDCCDHALGVRNIFMAAFYDTGNAYVRGHAPAPTAHAAGAGLRLDVAWFSFVERTVLRFDVAKTLNDSTGVQYWIGIDHPF